MGGVDGMDGGLSGGAWGRAQTVVPRYFQRCRANTSALGAALHSSSWACSRLVMLLGVFPHLRCSVSCLLMAAYTQDRYALLSLQPYTDCR